MAVQDPHTISTPEQMSETTSQVKGPQVPETGMATNPYKAAPPKQLSWWSTSSPLVVPFIAFLIIASLLLFGIGISLSNASNAGSASGSTSKQSTVIVRFSRAALVAVLQTLNIFKGKEDKYV